MINLFAVSENRNYAKCYILYLQEILGFSNTNPWLNKQLEDGDHPVRRSNRF